MSFAWKMTVTVVLFALCVVAAVILIVALLGTPPTVVYSAGAPGQPVNVTLQSVGSLGSGNHPDWVSYLVESPQGQWVHTTVFQVPAHTRINVTISFIKSSLALHRTPPVQRQPLRPGFPPPSVVTAV